MSKPNCQAYNCDKPATQVTNGFGHACAVQYKRGPYFHCKDHKPDNYFYPTTEDIEISADTTTTQGERQ